MANRIRYKVGDKIKLVEGAYWPFSELAVIVRKDRILSSNLKRVIDYWYVVKHECGEVRIVPRSYIEGVRNA